MSRPDPILDLGAPGAARDQLGPRFRLHACTIFVRDVNRALGFYQDQLGFRLVGETEIEIGRWKAIAPPDGTALLVLVQPESHSAEYELIGRSRHIIFVAEDVVANFHTWSRRGVRFRKSPQPTTWGGIQSAFEDPDGNSFVLVGYDAATREFEAQRRAAQELDIAKQVQARLFPQQRPRLETLDYAGLCLQARPVGGDYYDFMELGQNRLALLVGDIAGKGIPAALLMASLHACLHSQRSVALASPQQLLASVNQFLYENTPDNVYATLLFVDYADQRRHLRYANCGHSPGLLLRSRNSVEGLDSTCRALGLFAQCDGLLKEYQLFAGDILVLYSDGVTESLNSQGEEFSEEGLREAVWRHKALSAEDLLARVAEEIRHFSAHEQADDITLIVAKCK